MMVKPAKPFALENKQITAVTRLIRGWASTGQVNRVKNNTRLHYQ
jgi:hypothetical protein